MHRKAITYACVVIFLLALVGCAGQTAPAANQTDAKPTAATSAPAAKPAQSGSTGAESGDQNRWQTVKGWQGTFTADHTEVDVEKTANIGTAIKLETVVNRKNTATGKIVVDDAWEVEDGAFIWGAQEGSETNEASVSVDLKTVSKRYENGKLVMTETYTENGSGTVTMDWVEGAQVYILPEQGTYSLQISAGGIEVQATEKTVLSEGTVFTDDSGTKPSEEYLGGQIADIPLPATGLQLKGTAKTPFGQVVTWDLEPIQ